MGYYDDDDVGYYPEEVGRRQGRQRRQMRHEKRQHRSEERLLPSPEDRAEAARDGVLLPRSGRRLVLPLGSISLATTVSGTLQVNVQKPFQPDRVILNATVAPEAVLVTDIKVGVRSQFVTDASCPLTVFQPLAVRAEFSMDPASVGILISVDLTNTGGATTVVSGAIYGDAIS